MNNSEFFMKEEGMEPLSVVLVWNETDQTSVEKYIQYTTKMLSRDINRPFSRTINLPIFYYSNSEGNEVPMLPKLKSEKILIYVFIGINSASSDKWGDYVESLYDIENAKIVPIALDKYAYKVSDKVQNYNFIREYELTVCKEQQLFISMAHEIYRYGFNEKKEIISTTSALKIFLSHAKEGKNGLNIAKQLKELIDDSAMSRFFDSNDIAPGYRFDDEIINNIKESSVVIINSDIYSSRYWCQREIQAAKEFERPIIEIDLIDKAMDRKFPFAGNVPVVRVDIIDDKVEEGDLYRILENIMIETIRFNYVDKKLELLKLEIPGRVKKMCRPPEMIDMPKLIKKGEDIELKYDKIIYPDPPIYLADTLEVKKWKAQYRGLLEMKEIPIDETVSDLVQTDKQFLAPDTVDNWYVWSKSLSKMRYEMIKNCDARICAGGRKVGYKGKMPGVLEEILIASELGCPLYLLGGFGGVVRDVCELLQDNKCSDSLTEQWQSSCNKGYRELLQRYKEQGEEVDYLELQNKLRCINFNNGLTQEENEILFNTVYVDEAIQLILKGLQSI